MPSASPMGDPSSVFEKGGLMTKRIPLYSVLILMALTMLVTFNATYLAINEKHNRELNQLMKEYNAFGPLLSVDAVVKQYYIGEVDDETMKEALIRAYLEAIGDDYSLYMTSSEYDAYTEEQKGSSVGIGINVIFDADANVIEIISVLPDSPAEEAGIMSGDFIVAVNGQSLVDIGYYEAVDKIRGEKGTTVALTLRRNNEEITVTCERRDVKTVSVLYHVFADDASVGVIRITEFNGTTPQQFKAAIVDLQGKGCEKFVFDLRNNPGGELNSIIEVLDYLLPEGPLAHIYYQGGEDSHYTSEASCLDAPVAVLTNGQTASAAELFTAALRDYTDQGRYDATIVGLKTFGKGTLQRFFQLKDGAAFKISVGHYDPPYAENYDGVGIIPDLEVPLSEEAAGIHFNKWTDQNDNQLIAAVEALASK